MASTETVRVVSVSRTSTSTAWAEQHFYFFMSLLIATAVIYGFSHTVERNLVRANPSRPVLLWVHAILFSSWVAFYILQSALVRIRNVKLHRTLGWAGAALGATMVVIGLWVAVVMAHFETFQLGHNLDKSYAFLTIPLVDMTTFAACLGLAVVWRKKPERHRRLMLVATCALTAAAFGRMSMVRSTPPLFFYTGVDGLILLGAVRDLVVNRRIHAVYLISVPLLVAAQTVALQIYSHKAAFWLHLTRRFLG